MIEWKTKAAIFRVFEAVPYGAPLHYLAQRYVTKTWPRPTTHVEALIGAARRHIDDCKMFSRTPLADSTILEIGAGRDLIVPLAMRFLGARRIITIDIERLAKLDLVNSAAAIVAHAFGADPMWFSSWEALADFGVTYLAPLDLAECPDAIPQIDAFVSNEVLEHIPPSALGHVFEVASSKLRRGGVSIHSIDYSDHYARDGGVSRYNFLRYSDEEWRKFNPGMHYVNRMRHSEYIALMERTGFDVLEADTYAEDIPEEIEVASKFLDFDAADLRVMRSRIIAARR